MSNTIQSGLRKWPCVNWKDKYKYVKIRSCKKYLVRNKHLDVPNHLIKITHLNIKYIFMTYIPWRNKQKLISNFKPMFINFPFPLRKWSVYHSCVVERRFYFYHDSKPINKWVISCNKRVFHSKPFANIAGTSFINENYQY